MPAEDAAARRAAVLGHPVAHSLSPVLHRTAYAELGLPWEYDRVDVTPEQLPAFLDGLDASWAGLSLTMPLKAAVLPLLHEVDPVAAATGAANTVVLGPDGRRRGWNTDVDGLVVALRERGPLPPHPTAGVVGGGATARSAVAALARLGAATVLVALRRPEAAADLRSTALAAGVGLEVVGWDGVDDVLARDVVVSTVPSGAADPLALRLPARPGVLLDVVYDPWPTPLARAWADAGGAVSFGLDLLLHQAVRQVELMTGRTPSTAGLRAALEAAAGAR
ncbi:MAG: shikimate dehydrogenase [Candidatus Nanopelagicales bacterium]